MSHALRVCRHVHSAWSTEVRWDREARIWETTVMGTRSVDGMAFSKESYSFNFTEAKQQIEHLTAVIVHMHGPRDSEVETPDDGIFNGTTL